MVSQATIQAKVNVGFAKAANAAGVPCQQFRPTGAISPLDPGNVVGTLQVLFDTNASLRQIAPRQRQKPEEWYAAFDPSNVQVGDYLVTPPSPSAGGQPETLFVAALDPFRPARLVLCNRIIDIHAPGTMPQQGLNQGYGGDTRLRETVVAAGWPAAVLKGPRQEVGDLKLPGDTKLPWEEILLPPMPGAALRNDMIAIYTDAAGVGFRLILSTVELTSLGYRCIANLETA